MFRLIRVFCNNLNWAKRDRDIERVEQSYRTIIDLPRITNNTISVAEFESRKKNHMQLHDRILERYGNSWQEYLRGFSIN